MLIMPRREVLVGSLASLLVPALCTPTLAQNALSGPLRALLRKKQIAAAAPNNTALDGSVNTAGTGPLTMGRLDTTAAGFVGIFIALNGAATVSSVSGSSLGAFTQRAMTTNGTNGFNFWYKASAGALVNEIITIVVTNPGSYAEATAFGVKGVNTGVNNGFDSNVALPATVNSGNLSITTSNANDLLIVGFRGAGAGPITGWTPIAAGSFISTGYLSVTAAQSALTVLDPNSANGAIGDALVSA